MTTIAYLNNTRWVTRAIGKVLVSVGLVSPNGPAPENGPDIDSLLTEARLSLLPLMFLWDIHAPRTVRALAMRQYIMVVAISIGLVAFRFVEFFGMACFGIVLMQAIQTGYMNPSNIADRLFGEIAFGGFGLFAKIILVCWAIVMLSQPKKFIYYQ